MEIGSNAHLIVYTKKFHLMHVFGIKIFNQSHLYPFTNTIY